MPITTFERNLFNNILTIILPFHFLKRKKLVKNCILNPKQMGSSHFEQLHASHRHNVLFIRNQSYDKDPYIHTYIYIYIFDRLQRYIFLRHYIWCENLENVMPMLEKIAEIMNNHPWYFPAWSYNRSEDTHNPPNSHSYYWLRAFRIPIKGLFYAFWFQGKCFSQKKDVERGYFKDVLIMFGCYIFRRAPEKVRHGMYIFILLKISQSHVFETQKTT